MNDSHTEWISSRGPAKSKTPSLVRSRERLMFGERHPIYWLVSAQRCVPTEEVGVTSSARVVPTVMRQPTDQFDEACKRTIQYLSRIVPMAMWAVTRVEEETSTLLTVKDEAYGVDVGASLPFADLPCSYMVTGEAPPIAPDVTAVQQYANSGFAKIAPLGAYIGIPVTTMDGELFGTVCGYDPAPKPPTLKDCSPLMDMVATLLSAVLSADRAATEHRRRTETLSLEADTDSLTGLLNRRAWTRHLTSENPRYQRFGDPAAVVMLDLDGLKAINDGEGHARGDEYLVRAALAMRSAMRPSDIIARLGGDEFGIFAPGVSPTNVPDVIDRLSASFKKHEVAASIGWAVVDVLGGTAVACTEADERMYADKRGRRERSR